MTEISQSSGEIYKKVYANGIVSGGEYQMLRDDADLRIKKLIEGSSHFKQHSNITAFQKSMDVTMQLLQLSVLEAKKIDLNDADKTMFKDAMIAQVGYLRTGSELFLQHF